MGALLLSLLAPSEARACDSPDPAWPHAPMTAPDQPPPCADLSCSVPRQAPLAPAVPPAPAPDAWAVLLSDPDAAGRRPVGWLARLDESPVPSLGTSIFHPPR